VSASGYCPTTFWDTHCDPSTANGRNGGAHLAYFEELLKAGSSGYMVGAGLTAADLCVFDMVDLLLLIYPDQLPSAVRPQPIFCLPHEFKRSQAAGQLGLPVPEPCLKHCKQGNLQLVLLP
jgi:hypothetical protein